MIQNLHKLLMPSIQKNTAVVQKLKTNRKETAELNLTRLTPEKLPSIRVHTRKHTPFKLSCCSVECLAN